MFRSDALNVVTKALFHYPSSYNDNMVTSVLGGVIVLYYMLLILNNRSL